MRRCGRGRLEASHRAASRFSRPGCAPAGADGRADGWVRQPGGRTHWV